MTYKGNTIGNTHEIYRQWIVMFINAQTSNNVQTSIHEQTSKHDALETKETFYTKINVQTPNHEQTSLQSRGESMHVTPISKGATWDKYKNKQNPDKQQTNILQRMIFTSTSATNLFCETGSRPTTKNLHYQNSARKDLHINYCNPRCNTSSFHSTVTQPPLTVIHSHVLAHRHKGG